MRIAAEVSGAVGEYASEEDWSREAAERIDAWVGRHNIGQAFNGKRLIRTTDPRLTLERFHDPTEPEDRTYWTGIDGRNYRAKTRIYEAAVTRRV